MKKRGKRERERDHAAEGGSICIREHSGVNQDSGSLDSGVSSTEHDFSAKNLRIHSRATITRMENVARQGQITNGKSVCFFTTLDFIFESVFFAPTVTHC